MSKGAFMIYGRTKVGKSYAVHRCLNYFGLKTLVLVAENGALTTPKQHFLDHIVGAINVLSQEDPFGEAARRFGLVSGTASVNGDGADKIKSIVDQADAVVLDTGSKLVERMVNKNLTEPDKSGKPKFDVRQSYLKAQVHARYLIDCLLQADKWIFTIWHEQQSYSSEGRLVRGGPQVGRLVEDVSSVFDSILRAHFVSGQRVMSCDPMSGSWVGGDRFGVFEKMQLLDLRPQMFRILNPGKELPEELVLAPVEEESFDL